MVDSEITIVILTFNSIDHIESCIQSVLNQDYLSVNLSIVDNASSDGTVDLIRRLYPEIPIKVLLCNLGFSKAHNLMISETSSEFYMPLNPDVRLTPAYLSELFRVMETQDLAGSVVGKIMFMKDNGEITNRIYSTGHLLTRSRSPTNRGYKKTDTYKYERLELIFAANGAAPLYRREMLEDISLDGEYFCEDFFVYGEDHDLGWRAQLRGWKCIYNPKALAYHVGFGSGGINDFRVQIQFSRNRYLTLVRNDDLFFFIADLPFIIVYEFVLLFYWLFRSPRRILAHWIGIIQAFSSFIRTYHTRESIQERRKVRRSYIRSFFVSQLW